MVESQTVDIKKPLLTAEESSLIIVNHDICKAGEEFGFMAVMQRSYCVCCFMAPLDSCCRGAGPRNAHQYREKGTHQMKENFSWFRTTGERWSSNQV